MSKKVRKTTTSAAAVIVNGCLYFEDVKQCAVDSEMFGTIIGDGYTKAIRVESLDTQWVETAWIDWDVKLQSDVNVQMTLRREVRSGRGHWYAYRRVFGTLHKRYVGNDDNIGQKRLLTVARALPGV